MKKNKRRVRTKILIKYVLTLICTAFLWGVFTLLLYSPILQILREIKNIYFHDLSADTNFYYLLYIGASGGIYLIFALVISLVYLSKTAGLIDKSYDAFSDVRDNTYTASDLPKIIRPIHVKTQHDIETALKYRECLVQESEQRKNDLVVYLAHDLKAPLASIIGYLTLLKESPQLPPEYRAKYTDITLEKTYRLEHLINEFFDITRFNLQPIVLENNHIDLTMLINRIAEEFYPVLKDKGLSCNVSIQNRINISGDADKLSRVFDNLMRNAVAYSYSNTQITVCAYTENGKAVISFKNRGDKIPEQKLDFIFEKFFIVDSARASQTGGTGLGLAIAKQIVELHGGTITAKSDDYFTTFTVYLNL